MIAVQLAAAAQGCPRCGAHPLHLQTAPDRVIAHRNMPALPIPEHVQLLHCGGCGRWYRDVAEAAALHSILDGEYRRVLRARVRLAIEALSRSISQRRLEHLLGLSQGYLSRLKAGAGNPSPELVSHLALLAKDPRVRLAEIEAFWSKPDVLPDPASGSAENAAPTQERKSP